jgi:hypothetical protein
VSLEHLALGRRDWVAAAAIGGSVDALCVVRMVAGDVPRDEGVSLLTALVRRLAKRGRWMLSASQERRIAEGSWLLLTQPRCPTCRGQKIEPFVCADCGGTGNREIPRRHKAEISQVMNVLDALQGAAERAAERKMG